MRFGWLAAAAAMMCALPAEAARYYEFEIHGSADIADGFLPTSQLYRYSTVIIASFDTMTLGSGGFYEARNSFDVVFLSPTGRLMANATPDGPVFDFTIPLSAVANSLTLQAFPVNAGYSFSICDPRSPSTCRRGGSAIDYFAARTSDIAPAQIGLSEVTTVTPIPEPASWAMMILGAGVIGAAARRRRTIAFA